MHGRVKIKTSAAIAEQKSKERLEKANKYKAIKGCLLENRIAHCFDKEVLDAAEIVCANPDDSTVWSYRRNVLFNEASQRTSEEMQEMFESELNIVQICVSKNPKSYNAYFQRGWCLFFMPKPDFAKEKTLVGQLLNADDRNFHAWDHHRVVLALTKLLAANNNPSMKTETHVQWMRNCRLGLWPKFLTELSNFGNEFKEVLTKEISYTKEKIIQNFSNFSAWFYRSKLEEKYANAASLTANEQMVRLKEEYKFVSDAIFTDPNDQAPWFYRTWLLDRLEKLTNVDEPISFFSYQTNTGEIHIACVSKKLMSRCQVASGNWDGIYITGSTAINSNTKSYVWHKVFSANVLKLNSTDPVQKFADSGFCLHKFLEYSKKTCDECADGLKLSKSSYMDDIVGHSHYEDLKQLLEMEPNNKWLLLAMIQMSKYLEIPQENIAKYFSSLKSLDPKRRNFYTDYENSITIQSRIARNETLFKNLRTLCLESDSMPNDFRISKLILPPICISITCVSFNNQRVSSLFPLQNLVFLEKVQASNNVIDTLRGLKGLRYLFWVNVDKNNLARKDEIQNLQNVLRNNNSSDFHFSWKDNPVGEL